VSGQLRSLLTAVSAAVAAAGLAVAVLLMPWFTSVGVRVAGAPAVVELGKGAALEAAESARRYATGRTDVLPERIGESPAFDVATAKHLDDVRRVVATVRWVTIVALVALWNLVAHAVAHGTQAELARGLRWGGRALLVAAAGLALAGLADFSSAFVAFHEVFFPHGGWLFPDDALIIRLFPERFWTMAGAAFAVLVAAGGVVLLLASRFVRRLFDERPARAGHAPFGD
jgi:integral membrane protein (TIGR01906 family)